MVYYKTTAKFFQSGACSVLYCGKEEYPEPIEFTSLCETTDVCTTYTDYWPTEEEAREFVEEFYVP